MVITKGNSIYIEAEVSYEFSPIIEAYITIIDPEENILIDNVNMVQYNSEKFKYIWNTNENMLDGVYTIIVKTKAYDESWGQKTYKLRLE